MQKLQSKEIQFHSVNVCCEYVLNLGIFSFLSLSFHSLHFHTNKPLYLSFSYTYLHIEYLFVCMCKYVYENITHVLLLPGHIYVCIYIHQNAIIISLCLIAIHVYAIFHCETLYLDIKFRNNSIKQNRIE